VKNRVCGLLEHGIKWLAENNRTDGDHVNGNELPRQNVEL